jgi:uncharacterized protein
LGVRLFKTPELVDPVMIACWPGIGNVGLLAVETIKELLQAEEIGYIEPRDFFYPKKVTIKDGEIIGLDFPNSKFYYKKTARRDFLFFIGEEQPVWGNKAYAEGAKAYEMANMVIDVALKFGCRRIFTSGAAVTAIHHTMKSKVWVVPNNSGMIDEVKTWKNILMMSQVENREGQGSITGLNGLLLGVARKRGLDAICVMGEIPVYLQGFPILYPKGSKSVIELLSQVLDLQVDLNGIAEFVVENEKEIDALYDNLPREAKAQLDELRGSPGKTGGPQNITEDDKRKIMEDLDQFFGKKEDGNGET